MSLDSRYQAQLEDSYNEMLEEFYLLLMDQKKEMFRVENSEDEDDKINFIMNNLKDSEAQSGFDYDDDTWASYNDGLTIFSEILQKD